MHVTEIELIPIGLPFARPYATARGTLERREMLLVRLVSDAGSVGLGEAVPMSLRGGTDLRSIERALRKVSRRFRRADLSDFSGEDPIRAAVDAFVFVAAGRRLPAPAKAALEMALFDLAGKVAGQPIWRMLGLEAVEPVRCNATLETGPPARVAERAREWAERGFRTFKLKLGAGEDVAQVRAVREALGPEARIRVDANGAWGVEEALGVLRMIEPLDVELAEQPVGRDRDMERVTEASPIPVAADETVSSSKDAGRAVARRACDLTTVKLAKVGGMGEANGIARALPTYLSSALDGPLGIAAAAHAAQSLPLAEDLAHGLATQRLFSATTAAVECELEGDLLSPPAGPGLGVQLDDEAVERLRI